jgi:hypothetical protein
MYKRLCLIIISLSFWSGLGVSTYAYAESSEKVTAPKPEHKIVQPTNVAIGKLTSANFEVVFEAPYEDIAREFLISAEKARYSLAPYFKKMPDKVTIVIDDSTDLANGFATFFPYPIIHVYPIFPDDGSVLSNYGSWTDLLMMHEYVHSLQTYPSEGVFTPFRWIFGSIIRPNALLPTWMMEGVATDFESQLTPFGRLRSTLYNARIRALVRDDLLKKETLDRLSEQSIPTYPFGERPYFYGGLLSREVTTSKDAAVWGELFESYGRTIPFTFLNTRLEDKIKNGYRELLQKSYESYTQLVTEQLKVQRHQSNKIEAPGEIHYWPSVSPDGQWLVYFEREIWFGQSIRIVKKLENKDWDFKNSERIGTVESPSRIRWKKDSSSFLIDDVGQLKRKYLVKDVFEFKFSRWLDPEKKMKAIKKITDGERAHTAVYLDSEDEIAYLRNDKGLRTEIVRFNTKTKVKEVLLLSAFGERLSSLEFDRSDNSILFVKRTPSGLQTLHQISLLTKVVTPISVQWRGQQVTNISDIAAIENGGFTFFSDVTGTRNMFKADRDFKSVIAITDTPTYIHSGITYGNKLILNELYGSGTKLTQLDLQERAPAKVEPVIKSANTPIPTDFKLDQAKIDKSEYSALPYMLPRYWLPSIYSVQGGTMMQASTSASDPFGEHSYALLGEYDSFTNKTGYSFSYLNSNRMRTIGAYSQLYHVPLTYSSTDVVSSELQGVRANFYLSETLMYPALIGFNRNHIDYADILPLSRQGIFYGFGYLSDSSAFKNKNMQSNLISASVTHQNFLKDEGYTAYNQYAADFNLLWKWGLPSTHAFRWSLRGEFAPDLDFSLNQIFGQTTVGGNYYQSLIQSPMMMRGYPTGIFRGRHMINTNIEYSFDLAEHYYGLKHAPLFFKKTRVNFFLDALTMDGTYEAVNEDELVLSRDFKDVFLGTGVEFMFEMTLGYQFPFNMILGIYEGIEWKAYGGRSIFLGFVFGDVSSPSSLECKKPCHNFQN